MPQLPEQPVLHAAGATHDESLTGRFDTYLARTPKTAKGSLGRVQNTPPICDFLSSVV